MEHIIQISKPTLDKASIAIDYQDPIDTFDDSILAGQTSPLVLFSGNYYSNGEILDFKLSYARVLLPEIKLIIYDKASNIMMDNIDSTSTETFEVYMRSNAKDFEPISCTFLVTGFQRIGGNKISIRGEMFVPQLHTHKIRHYSGTSFEACHTIARDLGLGFASNVTSSNDAQNWLCLSQSSEDMLLEISAHSWIDDRSSIKVWIDPHYCLNYFDLGEAYRSDRTDFEKIGQTNKLLSTDSDKEQNLLPFVLTNHQIRVGKDTFIENYTPFDKKGELERVYGFDRVFRTEDLDRDQYFEYTLKQVVLNETIKRSGDNSRNSYTGYTNKNSHKNYSHSQVQNEINEAFYSAVGMKLDLSPINPAVYSGMIVPIMINNNDILNIDIKGGGEDSSYNESLSAYYVITEVSYGYKNRTFKTSLQAVKIRPDGK